MPAGNLEQGLTTAHMAGRADQGGLVYLVTGQHPGGVEGVFHRAGGIVVLYDPRSADPLAHQPVGHDTGFCLAILGHAAAHYDEGLGIGLGQGSGGVESPQQYVAHGTVGVQGIAQGDDGAPPRLVLIPPCPLLERRRDHPVYGGKEAAQIGLSPWVAGLDPVEILARPPLVALDAQPDRQIGEQIHIIGGGGQGLVEQGDGPVQLAVVDLGVGGRDEQIGAIGLELIGLQQPGGDELHVARHLGGEAGIRDAGGGVIDLPGFTEQLIHHLALADELAVIRFRLQAAHRHGPALDRTEQGEGEQGGEGESGIHKLFT